MNSNCTCFAESVSQDWWPDLTSTAPTQAGVTPSRWDQKWIWNWIWEWIWAASLQPAGESGMEQAWVKVYIPFSLSHIPFKSFVRRAFYSRALGHGANRHRAFSKVKDVCVCVGGMRKTRGADPTQSSSVIQPFVSGSAPSLAPWCCIEPLSKRPSKFLRGSLP